MANPLGMKPSILELPPEVERNLAKTGIGDLIKGLVFRSYEAGFDEACIKIHETSQWLAKTGQA